MQVSFNNIGTERALQLSTMLVNNSSLRVLKINNNKIGDRGLCHLAIALRTIPLEELFVGYNEIGSVGVLQLLGCVRGLRVLQLSGSNLGADGAHALAGYLSQETTLSSIYLDHAGLGTMGER